MARAHRHFPDPPSHLRGGEEPCGAGSPWGGASRGPFRAPAPGRAPERGGGPGGGGEAGGSPGSPALSCAPPSLPRRSACSSKISCFGATGSPKWTRAGSRPSAPPTCRLWPPWVPTSPVSEQGPLAGRRPRGRVPRSCCGCPWLGEHGSQLCGEPGGGAAPHVTPAHSQAVCGGQPRGCPSLGPGALWPRGAVPVG